MLRSAYTQLSSDFTCGNTLDMLLLLKSILIPSDLQVVAIKKVDPNDKKKFLVEILMLSLLHHPNIVPLIGYCTDGDHQRLVVYKYMPLGSLKHHLHGNLQVIHNSFFAIFDHFR